MSWGSEKGTGLSSIGTVIQDGAVTVFICHLSGMKKKAEVFRTCELKSLWRDAEDCRRCSRGGLGVIVVDC